MLGALPKVRHFEQTRIENSLIFASIRLPSDQRFENVPVLEVPDGNLVQGEANGK
jgi:hypothetical protein